jgi:hypothetical protein
MALAVALSVTRREHHSVFLLTGDGTRDCHDNVAGQWMRACGALRLTALRVVRSLLLTSVSFALGSLICSHARPLQSDPRRTGFRSWVRLWGLSSALRFLTTRAGGAGQTNRKESAHDV